jgi:hypothetical protein
LAIKNSEDLHPFDIPLNGGTFTDLDPMFLGLGDFQSLKNLRHKTVGKQGLSGMTQVGSFAGAIRSGYQFNKTSPDESHIFIHSGSTVYKSANSADVPAPDTYTSFLASSATPVNMSNAPDNAMVICNGTNNYIWRGDEARCGLFAATDKVNFYESGSYWNDFTHAVNNNLQTSGNFATLKDATGHSYIVIGSPLPVQGITFYIKTASAVVGILSAYQRTGELTAGLTVPLTASDGTSGLTKSGKITFTVAYPQPTIVNDVMAFYYLLDFDGVDDGVEIYQCTLDIPVQPIQDIWVGIPLSPLACLIYRSAFADNLLKVSGISPYVSADANTYAELGSMTSAHALYVGFDRRMTALQFNLPDDACQNTGSSITVTVYYYDGDSWVSVGSINDGTIGDTTVTMGNSGTISWVPPALGSEGKTSLFNTVRLYYYKLVFSAELHNTVRVHQITGIPAQKPIIPYKFPLFWQNRLLLCNDTSNRKNSILVTSTDTAQVVNGSDSAEIPIGNGQELVAGATLFTRYGGSLYDNVILFKKNSAHLIDGASLTSWRDYMVSDSVGCIAPKTLQKCDMGYEVAPGLTKHVLLWMSFRGIEFFDGNTLSCVSDDIKNFFDKSSDDYINVSIADTFTAFYDATYMEYHILFASGSSTTLNEEWIYDLKAKKWSEANRGTGKGLTFGFSLSDTIGIQYNYAGTTDYKLERLEYGTTFDGNAITYEFHTGDIGLAKTLNYQTKVRNIKFIAKTKTTSTANVTITHYADGSTTGTALPVFTQNKSGYRIYQTKRSVDLPEAVVHSFKVTVATTNENVGFEPLYLGGFFRIIREDI